ncbi:MAG: aminoglycoside 3'-phosphotransferase [SAR324 cluster bacterium]|nr:aminoglycoside 3'-phosphotransferase [SAR324 cluster bacterium]
MPNWIATVAWAPFDHACTYRLSHPNGTTKYLKMVQRNAYPSIADELERLRWAKAFLPVPKIIDFDLDDDPAWLLSEGIAGTNGTEPDLKSNPALLVSLLARALRHFHNHAPVSSCPFDFRLEPALEHVSKRVQLGLIEPQKHFHPEFQHLSLGEAQSFLKEQKPSSTKEVVCHGDYCVPNILFDNNRLQGFVDLGELGVADVWWDLAVATWSLNWNIGDGWEELFLKEYGVPYDHNKNIYYRLLYDLVS